MNRKLLVILLSLAFAAMLYAQGTAPTKISGYLIDNPCADGAKDLGPRAKELDNVEVMFFGERTAFPTIAANLARVSGAPIVVAAVTRERDNTFRGVALPPIFVKRTKQAAHDIEHTTQAIVQGLEQLVRLDPDQWYIFRPMWTRPEGTV